MWRTDLRADAPESSETLLLQLFELPSSGTWVTAVCRLVDIRGYGANKQAERSDACLMLAAAALLPLIGTCALEASGLTSSDQQKFGTCFGSPEIRPN